MLPKPCRGLCRIMFVAGTLLAASGARADFTFGPRQVVTASGADISVGSYSVPCYGDWDDDGRNDLILGRGDGRVSVYPNTGTAQTPAFSTAAAFDVTADGSFLDVGSSGCMGSFPRLVDWNNDTRKDLVVSDTWGQARVYLNQGSPGTPALGAGTLLQVGLPGSKTDIDVGSRAAACVVDWDSDGRKDLVLGELMGHLHVFHNLGTDASPDFRSVTVVPDAATGVDLEVPGLRSSPTMADLDGDGLLDLVTGNTGGQLFFYSNVGTSSAPEFGPYTHVEGGGVPIDLPDDARSRPFLCDWTGDGWLDVLIGAQDGKVYLYEGVPEPATLALLAMGGAVLLARRRR